MRSSDAPSRAASNVSATTTATCWPSYFTSALCRGASCSATGSGVTKSNGSTGTFGAFRCVSSSTTPGTASVAASSNDVMRPKAIVDCTMTACSGPGTGASPA